MAVKATNKQDTRHEVENFNLLAVRKMKRRKGEEKGKFAPASWEKLTRNLRIFRLRSSAPRRMSCYHTPYDRLQYVRKYSESCVNRRACSVSMTWTTSLSYSIPAAAAPNASEPACHAHPKKLEKEHV